MSDPKTYILQILTDFDAEYYTHFTVRLFLCTDNHV